MTGAREALPDGWAIHLHMQLEAALATTPLERLTWLEEAIRFAFAAGALPRPAGALPRREPPTDRVPSLEGD